MDILKDGAKGWPEAGGKEDAGARFYARRVERAGGLCLERGVWLAMSRLFGWDQTVTLEEAGWGGYGDRSWGPRVCEHGPWRQETV